MANLIIDDASLTRLCFQDPAEVLRDYGVDEHDGLDDDEVRKRVALHGRNALPEEKETPFLKLVLKQFEDLLVIILLVAAVVSFVLAWFEESKDRVTAFVEPVVILLILIANAAVGVTQEQNAEKAIRALKAYEAEEADVVRNGGCRQRVPAASLVPGDIVHVGAGSKVPADCRVVLARGAVRVDQSILTGESDSVLKHAEAVSDTDDAPRTKHALSNQDKTNVAFSGTLLTRGKAVCVVVATGARTAIGRIQRDIADQEEEKTPLKLKLDEFGEQLSKLIARRSSAEHLIATKALRLHSYGLDAHCR